MRRNVRITCAQLTSKRTVVNDQEYMQLALDEAVRGLGRTAPNPAVGAVIVNGDAVVGRGYHQKAGTAHAEVNAIQNAGGSARGGTIYVTLEPCNHTGRTPPCTRAILEAGIRRVVIGAMDPNPKVVGGGAAFLRQQGIDVLSGVLEEQCIDLIRFFVKHNSSGTPWVILKAGLSLDGKIAYERGRGGAITGAATRQMVHMLRDQVDAILIGVDTALVDNPSLTTRIPGKVDSRDPLRIVLDTHLRFSPQAKMLCQQSTAPTWIFCSETADIKREQTLVQAGAVVQRMQPDGDGRLDLARILAFLGEQQLTSVLVEGGAAVHGAFWKQGLVDELQLFYAPFFIGDQGISLMSGFALEEQPTRSPLRQVSLRQSDGDFVLRAKVAR